MSKVPYQLLELSIISAQDLAPLSKNLRTYAITWINPDRKLRTRTDPYGQVNPTWNDKFVFRVNDKFLDSEKSFVMIEIYALGWLRDTPVGSVRVLISDLMPRSVRQDCPNRRFVALQIRRPSGRPQGILNMGVALLDNTMRSMPLQRELSASTVALQDLVGGEDEKRVKEEDDNENEKTKPSDGNKVIQLTRSMSDTTDLTRKSGGGRRKKKGGGGSICNGSVRYYGVVGGSSIVTDGSFAIGSGGRGGGGSVVNGGGLVANGGSVVNGGSMLNGSMCNSDVGPSPSVVAAAVACGLYPTQLGPPPKPGSSVLEDWTVEESSMEGLRMKIERWRMELPQYDQGYRRLDKGAGKMQYHRRRRTIANDGSERRLFSCFGNALGCEFRIVCGAKSTGKKADRSRGGYNSSKTSSSESSY